MSKLDPMFIETETNQIMDRIYKMNDKKRFGYKKLLFSSITAIVIFVLSFSLSGIINTNDTNSILKIEKVKADEYKLYSDENSLIIQVNTYIENKNLIQLNENLSYYDQMNKYINVSDRNDLEIIEIKDNEFLKLSIDQRIYEYLYIVRTDKTFILFNIDYEFVNFKEEMNTLLEQLKLYPPVIAKVNLKDEEPEFYKEDLFYDKYFENEMAKGELDKEAYERYLWYIELQEIISRQLVDSKDVNSFRANFYLDGDEESLGNIVNRENQYLWNSSEQIDNMDYKYKEFPVKIKDCSLIKLSSTNSSSVRTYRDYSSNHCTNESFKDTYLTSMIIDFSQYTDLIDLNHYDIDIKLTSKGDTYLVNENQFVVDGTKLYVMPTMIQIEDQASLNIEVTEEVIIKDRSGNIIIQHRYSSSFKNFTRR